MPLRFLLCIAVAGAAWAHDAHGRSNAPTEARRLKNPLSSPAEHLAAAQRLYASQCASCHGPDGRARTATAAQLAQRPTDLSNYLMESMKDGEIFWVVKHGIDSNGQSRMPAFAAALSDHEIWQLVFAVRALRDQQRAVE
ncbi:c-type cytochrome, partial [Nostoc sp. NIES-2111]